MSRQVYLTNKVKGKNWSLAIRSSWEKGCSNWLIGNTCPRNRSRGQDYMTGQGRSWRRGWAYLTGKLYLVCLIRGKFGPRATSDPQRLGIVIFDCNLAYEAQVRFKNRHKSSCPKLDCCSLIKDLFVFKLAFFIPTNLVELSSKSANQEIWTCSLLGKATEQSSLIVANVCFGSYESSGQKCFRSFS